MRKILQGFKQRWYKHLRKKRGVYICDPYRARDCSKVGCWELSKGPCKCTTKKAYAKRDINGELIVATDMDLWNEEFFELIANQMTENPASELSEKSQKKQGL